LVFMGGIDATNETKKVLQTLIKINFQGTVDVVVGNRNPFAQEIFSICNLHKNYNFYKQIENISDLMLKADFAIGAGGSSVWERCCLALPAATICLADNQESNAKIGNRKGFLFYLGRSDQLNIVDLTAKINNILQDKNKINEISKCCYNVVDGFGCQRIVEKLIL